MSIINKYDSCIGITLFRFFSYRAEIWFCPSGYEIVEHTHPGENVELIYLWGDTVFYRRNNNDGLLEQAIPKFGKFFTVKYYHSHWFKVGIKPLIFINLQKFLPGSIPMSAAKDFKITKNT